MRTVMVMMQNTRNIEKESRNNDGDLGLCLWLVKQWCNGVWKRKESCQRFEKSLGCVSSLVADHNGVFIEFRLKMLSNMESKATMV